MKTTSCGSSFYDLEQGCELLFMKKGPYWHLYTDGNKSPIIFTCREDLIAGMNIMATCTILHHNVQVLTFELMNNHLHMILSGSEYACRELFDSFRRKLKRYYARNGKCVDLTNFDCHTIRITDLRMLRNEIAYVNRNGYAAHSEYTPFSYPWGAGAAYFNPLLKGLTKSQFIKLPLKSRREICKSRNADLSENILVHNGVILPSSYCDIDTGEHFYRNATHYFNAISKNYEAYSAIAERLHESVFITDEEMFSAVVMICLKKFNTKQPSLLSSKEKIEVARIMHNDYNASNRQIGNILKIEKEIIKELFPIKK